MAEERLQKIVARAGLASRRKAEEWIVTGRVRVNGRVVKQLGARADADHDRIEVDGRRLFFAPPATFLLYKPRGVVTTLSDPEGRKTVFDLMKSLRRRVFPIGRLDFQTGGALLLTSDGELANGLLHPRQPVPRVYRLKIKAPVPEAILTRWAAGVEVDGRVSRPAKVQKLGENAENAWVLLSLLEARSPPVQRLCDVLGLRLMRATLMSFAGLSIEGMRPGDFRQLERREITLLRRFAAHPEPRTRMAPPPGGAEAFGDAGDAGDEDDGTWSAWNDGTLWDGFDESETPASAAPVADGVVRRARRGEAPGGAAPHGPPREEGPAPLRGRLPGRFDDEDEPDARPAPPPRDRRRPEPVRRDDRGRRGRAFATDRPSAPRRPRPAPRGS